MEWQPSVLSVLIGLICFGGLLAHIIYRVSVVEDDEDDMEDETI